MSARVPSFGLVTPIVTLNPRAHGKWEEAASVADLREIAVAADSLGYDFLTASEHAAIPKSAAGVRGSRYYDPLATLGYMAALTARIRLVSHVVVLPYSHPVAIAKRFATLDLLAGGRVVLGVGVGSLEEEFELLGVDFAGRGPRFEEGLRALRAALGSREPEFAGEYFRFAGIVMDPAPVQAHVPIWLGGRSRRSLRRALEWGDGWIPFGVDLAGFDAMMRHARERGQFAAREERGESPPEILAQPEFALELASVAGVDAATRALEGWLAAGATGLKLRFRVESVTAFVDALETFQAKVAPRLPVA